MDGKFTVWIGVDDEPMKEKPWVFDSEFKARLYLNRMAMALGRTHLSVAGFVEEMKPTVIMGTVSEKNRA